MNIKKIYWKRASSLPENEVSLLWEMDTLLCKFFCCRTPTNRLLCIIHKPELELEKKNACNIWLLKTFVLSQMRVV